MEDKEVRRVPQALIIQYIRKIKILPIDNLVAPTGVAHPLRDKDIRCSKKLW